jgi:UDP-N-acetylmuramyl pentapeptide phosphotransferase/UDP-N-acetylglucosamine-1-phosphate transferase/glycosyltransferase involved in cell wall biosynthesis
MHSPIRTLGVVDLPGARKVHRSPIPRIGGVAIAVAFFMAAVPTYLMVFSGADVGLFGERTRVASLFLAAAFLFVVGLVDDIVSLSSKLKLVALVLASVAFCSAGGLIRGMSVNGVEILNFGLFAWPITILWLVAVTVSVNFIDGLDGLAVGVLAIGASVTGNLAVGVIAIALLGSLSGFLVFNFNPAKVFMGDCGSMFIGFVLAGTGVLLSSGGGSTRGILLPALCMAIPFLDLVFTVIRRGILQRRSLFSAERGHVHHRLLDIGLGHRHVVILLYGVSLLAGAVALLSLARNKWLFVGGATLLVPSLIVLFRTAGSVRWRETLHAIRRNRSLSKSGRRDRHAFEELQLRFRGAKTIDSWWTLVGEAADRFGFVTAVLSMVNRDGTPRVMKWRRADELYQGIQTLRVALPIKHRRSGDALTADIEVAIDGALEAAGQRVALFSRLMGEYSISALDSVDVRGRTPAPSRRARIVPTDDAGAIAPVNPSSSGPRVAIVHDFLYTYAGAEKVVEQMLAVFPDADIFSLFDFLPADQREFLRGKTVTTSFLQNLPFIRKKHRAFLPLMPLAIEQLDVSAYDVVISSSYCVAKGVITRPDQLHACYCHTPIRFAWDLQHQYLFEGGFGFGPRGLLARAILHYVRTWDARSAGGVDVFLTNSNFVGRRIEKFYRRSSTTIYPPVDTELFCPGATKEDFYVTASRMVPYKRIDLIVEAFTAMPDRRLIVIGDGPDMEKIRAKAGPNVRILGHQPGERLRQYLQMARAFVFVAEEDFGIAPVEAQACGTPVIAYGRGGAGESVIPNETGVLFYDQSVEGLIEAVRAFERVGEWNRAKIRSNAARFSASRFREEFGGFIRREWVKYQTNHQEALVVGETLPDPALADREQIGATLVAAAIEKLERASVAIAAGEHEHDDVVARV